MGVFDIVIIIIVIIVVMGVILLFAGIFGHTFRQWNSGDPNYDQRESNKGSSWATFAIGIFIVLLLLAMTKGC